MKTEILPQEHDTSTTIFGLGFIRLWTVLLQIKSVAWLCKNEPTACSAFSPTFFFNSVKLHILCLLHSFGWKSSVAAKKLKTAHAAKMTHKKINVWMKIWRNPNQPTSLDVENGDGAAHQQTKPGCGLQCVLWEQPAHTSPTGTVWFIEILLWPN